MISNEENLLSRCRYRILLVGLMVFILMSPLFESSLRGDLAIAAAATFLMLCSLLVFPSRYYWRIGGTILALFAVAAQWSCLLLSPPVGPWLGDLFGILMLVVVGWAVVLRLPKRGSVGPDQIAAGISVYLIIALIWARLYHSLSLLVPESYLFQGSTENTPTFHDFTYYSFVTLTTLGYGDLVPHGATAKSLAMFEAVVGVFYLAVLVSRLVSLYQQPDKREDAQ